MKLLVPQKHLGSKSFLACLTFIYLVMNLSIDMYVPALPAMHIEFSVSEAYLNSTIFFFFVFSAFGVIIAGPLSDATGRKPFLVGSCVAFTAASGLCALPCNVETLVMLRSCQAFAFGSIQTLTTAMVKDAYEGRDLQIATTCMQSLVIIGPAIAPFLGSFFLVFASWRFIFVFLAAGGTLSIIAACGISDTISSTRNQLPCFSQTLKGTVADIKKLVRSKAFVGYTFVMSFVGVPFFAYLAVNSYILLDFFDASYFEYCSIYAIIGFGGILAPYLYIWLSKYLAPRKILFVCIALISLSAALMLSVGAKGSLLFFVAFLPSAFAEGITRPMSYVLLLNQPVDRVGSSSSLVNFAYNFLTAIATAVATLRWPSFVFGMGIITAASVVLVIASYLVGRSEKCDKYY